MKIVYATKAWTDFPDVAARHRQADLLVLNNANITILDIGETNEPYYHPELKAVRACDSSDYILWYAGDVIPPTEDWTAEAIKLLDRYPMVSPFWEGNYDDYLRMAEKQARGQFEETDFGFADQCFSDQAYFAKVSTMQDIDYLLDHPIKELYPEHGGNSFERRVAQWLAVTGQKRAVLKNYRYQHIPKENK